MGLVASPRGELGPGGLGGGASPLLARQISTPRSPGSPLAGNGIDVNCCCLKPLTLSKIQLLCHAMPVLCWRWFC